MTYTDIEVKWFKNVFSKSKKGGNEMDLQKLYDSNKDFQTYVDKYTQSYRVTREQAFSHLLVRIVAKYYMEKGA